jgi:sterol desaturase/sphingolipid hydroxylase (fatty acid hydroxylase superfamily)
MKLHQSMDAHCGYILPFPLSPYNCYAIGLDCAGNHDFHHSANVGCYGGYFQFWDHIMGTNTAYLKAKAKEAKGA